MPFSLKIDTTANKNKSAVTAIEPKEEICSKPAIETQSVETSKGPKKRGRKPKNLSKIPPTLSSSNSRLLGVKIDATKADPSQRNVTLKKAKKGRPRKNQPVVQEANENSSLNKTIPDLIRVATPKTLDASSSQQTLKELPTQISLPKKRGRKRKIDNTAENIRIKKCKISGELSSEEEQVPLKITFTVINTI